MNTPGLKDLARWPKHRWKVTVLAGAAVIAAVGGMIGVGLAPSEPRILWALVFGLAGAGVGGGGTLSLFLLIRQQSILDESDSQIRALVNVRPLTGRLPLDLGDWAADPILADTLVRICLRRRPRQVLECGSGWSTVIMAACLRELGSGRLTALEHQSRHAEQTRKLLESTGCDDRASVVLAPLEAHDLAGSEWLWYQLSATTRAGDMIDVLAVDGPPGQLQGRSRYPAVPLLRERLSEHCMVVLDDGYREDEAWIASAWGETLGCEPKFLARGRGIWVLEKTADRP